MHKLILPMTMPEDSHQHVVAMMGRAPSTGICDDSVHASGYNSASNTAYEALMAAYRMSSKALKHSCTASSISYLATGVCTLTNHRCPSSKSSSSLP